MSPSTENINIQLEIVTSFRIRTPSSSFYDGTVVFHITWNRTRAGEVVSKYLTYDEHGGRNGVRLEQGGRREIINSYGTCFDVSSVDQCWARLSKAALYNVPKRKERRLTSGR